MSLDPEVMKTGGEWAALGAFGGVVRVIVAMLRRDKFPPPVKVFWLLFANGLVSGFSGYIGAVGASTVSPNGNLHIIAAGVFGWLGVTGLELLAEKLKSKITL